MNSRISLWTASRTLVLVSIVVVVTDGSQQASATAVRTPAVREVTGLPLGHFLLEGSRAQLGASSNSDRPLRVFILGKGGRIGHIVTPDRIAGFTLVEDKRTGVVDYEVQAIRTVDASDNSFNARAVTSQPYWMQVGSSCSLEYIYAFGKVKRCDKINKLMNDGDGTWDHYAVVVWDSGIPNPGKWVRQVRLVSDAWGSETQHWEDWDPKNSTTTSCLATSIGVSAGGVGISFAVTKCEAWDIYIYSDAAHYLLYWNGVVQGVRTPKFTVGTKVAQGGIPAWWFSYGAT